MTSMLFSVSMSTHRKKYASYRPPRRRGGGGSRIPSLHRNPGALTHPAAGVQPTPLLLRPRLLDVLRHHVLVRGEPVGSLHELTALHLPDLHEPAALVVGGRDLQ